VFKQLIPDWTEVSKRLNRLVPDIITPAEEKDFPLPYKIRDIYRDFILSKLTQEERIKISFQLKDFLKKYPDIGIKILINSGNLDQIKDLFKDAIKKMESNYDYEGITRVCSSIIDLFKNDNKFHYEILKTLGKAWYSRAFFKKAIEYYEQALKIAREQKWAESDPYGWIGISYFNLGQYKKAIDYLQRALNIAKIFREDRKLEGFWLGCLANAYRDSDLPQAKNLSISLYNEALVIARDTRDLENESRWLANKGNAIRDLGQSIEARKYYEQALEIAEEIGDKFLQGRWLNNIGNTYADVGQSDKAIEYYIRAVKISRDCGDHYNENISLGNLAYEYNRLQRFEEAIGLYKEALEITMKCKDIERAKGHLNGLLTTYKKAGKFEKITEYLKEKLDGAKKYEDYEQEVLWLIYLGYVFQDLGQLKEAKGYYNQALEIARQLENPEYESSIFNLLDELSLLEVETLYASGQIENALEKCNALIKEIIGRGFGRIIKSLCEVYKNKYPLDTLNEEIENYRNQINSNPSNSNLHSKLADCYARKGNLADAVLKYQEAISLDASNILTVLSMMEVTVWRKEYAEAVRLYQKWSERITSPEHKVIAAWIICTALALDSQPYEDYINPLLDLEVSLVNTGYSHEDILPYFDILLDESFPIDRLINAWELHILFARHFIDVGLEDIVKDIPQELPNELKEGLMELLRSIVPSVDSPLFRAYMKRGLIYRVLGNLNMAIKDYILATIYNPNSDEAHMAWGACLAQKGELERAIPKYATSIELNPTNKMAFLGKMEAEICLRRYKEAMTTYERLREAALTPKEEVIAASLVCISLALDGKSYEDYTSPLLDMEIQLSDRHDWCTVEIDRHLGELEKEGYIPNRVTKAKKIQALFKKHFFSRDKISDRKGRILY